MNKGCGDDHSGPEILCDKERPVRDPEALVSICDYGEYSA
jgi:hypothetical protein